MLVLSRKSQQTIRIGDSITVTILNVKGNTVRVGIDAPRDIRVVRGELPIFTDSETCEETCEQPVTTRAAGATQTDAFDDQPGDPQDEIAHHRYLSQPEERLHPLRERLVTRPR